MEVETERGTQTWSDRFVSSWIHGVTTAAPLVFALGVALSVRSLWYATRHMEFLTGRNNLVSTDKRYLQLDDAYAKAFHGLDQVVVVAESPDLETTKAFIRRLGAVLQADTEHIAEATYRIDTASLEGKKLLLLSLADLPTLHDNVVEAQEVMEAITKAPGLNQQVQN